MSEGKIDDTTPIVSQAVTHSGTLPDRSCHMVIRNQNLRMALIQKLI